VTGTKANEVKPSTKPSKPGSEGRSRRAKGRATRQRIIEVATEMFSSGGYEATSLRQIASGVGIDLATLKYHYGDKAALFVEIYDQGHQAYRAALGPLAQAIAAVPNADALRAQLPQLVAQVHAHLEANLPFVRMTLYRMLEAPEQVIEREEQIQDELVALIVVALEQLRGRGIIRDSVDARSVAVMLIASFSMLFVSTQTKPELLGAPAQEPARFQAFFIDLLDQLLVG
jgi:AcrR family transcriptional regulator